MPEENEFCSLGQALLALKGRWRIIAEEAFRAIRTPKDLPQEPDLREALVVALADRSIRHTGTLVLMDYDHLLDENGGQIRQEVVLQILQDDYSAAPELLNIRNIDL